MWSAGGDHSAQSLSQNFPFDKINTWKLGFGSKTSCVRLALKEYHLANVGWAEPATKLTWQKSCRRSQADFPGVS